jgi:hypothetical protein
VDPEGSIFFNFFFFYIFSAPVRTAMSTSLPDLRVIELNLQLDLVLFEQRDFQDPEFASGFIEVASCPTCACKSLMVAVVVCWN